MELFLPPSLVALLVLAEWFTRPMFREQNLSESLWNQVESCSLQGVVLATSVQKRFLRIVRRKAVGRVAGRLTL